MLLIMLAALLLRLAYWQDAKGYALRGDEPDYVLPAQTLAREGSYVDTFIVPGRTWTRVPLTSFAFALSYLFVPDAGDTGATGDNAALMQPRYEAANLLQIGMSLATVALIMALAWKAFPMRRRAASLVAGTIAALYPPLASSAAQNALSETTAIMLIFLGVYALSWWSPQMERSRAFWIVCGAGGVLGLAALARPVALAFLPFAWLWLLIGYREHEANGGREGPTRAQKARASTVEWLRRYRRPLTGGALATVACLLSIAPWTLYNYRHYGRLLLLDTASANALWDFHNYRREDITARLWALPNPADRLSLTVKEATANIVEHPTEAGRGTLFALGYFWHLEIQSAVLENPWDMTQRDPDVPNLVHTDAAFLLVSLAAVAGLAGVGLRKPVDTDGRTLLLLDLWPLASLLVGLIVPSEARYRLPAAPAFIIMAAGLMVLADWRAVFSRRAWGIVRSYPRVALLTALLCAWVLIGACFGGLPATARSIFQGWLGDMQAPGAARDQYYQQAQAAFPSFYWPYRHNADAIRLSGAAGRDDEARVLYDKALKLNADDPYGILGLADLAYRDDLKLTKEEHAWLSREEDIWRGNPWNSFQPSPTASVDVGDGREPGYILGFYGVEDAVPGQDYRWSRGRAEVRIPVPADAEYRVVTLNMSAPALGGAGAMDVGVSVNGDAPVKLKVAAGWGDYTVPLRAGDGAGGKTVTLEITSPTRSPAELEAGSNDTRRLGVGVASVKLGW